jgi:hypothetical protein
MSEKESASAWNRVATSSVLRIGPLLFLVLATAVLTYYAYIAEPVQIADVIQQAVVLNGVSTVNVQTAGRVDNGLVPLVINGTVTDPAADRLTLITQAPGGGIDQVQATCCVISGQTFVGTAQVGTTASPVTGRSAVTFRLMSTGTDTMEAAGTFAVSVESFPGGDSKLAIDIIAVLSLVATFIQIGQWLLARRGRSRGDNDAQPA